MKPTTSSRSIPDQFDKAPAISAFRWLLSSGIQERQGGPEFLGGVNAWWDSRIGAYPFIYAEITAYAVNAYLFLYHESQDPDAFKAARLASEWLIHQQDHQTGLVKTRINHSWHQASYFDSWAFTFDQWIIVYALANIFDDTQENSFLEGARRLADFLIEKTRREEGLFFPIYDRQTQRALAPGGKWSRQAGGYHAKALLGLLKLHSLAGGEQYERCAIELKDAILSTQQEDGRFITQGEDQSTHLHPHLYTLEGLLSFGLAREDELCLGAVQKGLGWVFDQQRPDGSLFAFFQNGTFLPYVRTDIMAQALRLGILLQSRNLFGADETSLERLRRKLLTYQIPSGSQRGGFLYCQEENGEVHDHVNAWVTMFAAQALWLSAHLITPRQPYDMSCFV